MSREITYSLKIGWSGKNDPASMLIGSGLIGTGLLAAGAFSAFYTGTYDDVTADTKGIKVTRGRGNTLDAFNMGELVVTLWDRNGTVPNGKYNPFNQGFVSNRVLNPKAAVSTVNWAHFVSTSTSGGITQATGLAGVPGGFTTALQCTMNAGGTSGGLSLLFANGDAGGVPIAPVSPGDSVWCMGVGRVSAGVSGTTLLLEVRWFDSVGVEISEPTVASVTQTVGTWYSFSGLVIAPAGAAFMGIGLLGFRSATEAQTLQGTGFMCVKSTVALPYADGDTLNGRWFGTPNNSFSYGGSPLYGQLRPMRPCQLTATIGATTYGLFNGWLADGQDNYDWDTQEATYHFVDLYDWLDAEDGPVIASIGPTTTGAAIARILQAMGWPNTLQRLDVGDALLDFSSDGTKSALQLIQDLLTAERGIFFFSGDGYATYQDRHHWSNKTVADFQIQLARGVLPGFDIKSVINRARVTRTDLAGVALGPVQEVIDQLSRAEFGIRAPGNGTIQTPFVSSDLMAYGLAAYIVGTQRDPNNKIWGIEMMEDTVDTIAMVAADIGSWINLQTQGAVGDYTLERIEASGAGGQLHSVKFGLSQRPTNVPLIIGSGLVGTGAFGY
jgi:hypothetical protein